MRDKGENGVKRVLVIQSAAMAGGNTDRLADAFVRGAQDAGHEVKKFSIGQLTVNGCLGCNACLTNGGQCVQQDDMQRIYPYFYDCDVLCAATPIYCYAITARLKAFFERLYAAGMGEVPMREPHKQTILLATAAESGTSVFQQAVTFYQTNNAFAGWHDAGMVLAGGCGGCPGPRHLARQWEEAAYQLGKNL